MRARPACCSAGLPPVSASPRRLSWRRRSERSFPPVPLSSNSAIGAACGLMAIARLHVPGFTVTAVDSTAAGDTFNGALAVALAEGLAVEQALAVRQRRGRHLCHAHGRASLRPDPQRSGRVSRNPLNPVERLHEHRLWPHVARPLAPALAPPVPYIRNPRERTDFPLGRWNLYIGGGGTRTPATSISTSSRSPASTSQPTPNRLPFRDLVFRASSATQSSSTCATHRW